MCRRFEFPSEEAVRHVASVLQAARGGGSAGESGSVDGSSNGSAGAGSSGNGNTDASSFANPDSGSVPASSFANASSTNSAASLANLAPSALATAPAAGIAQPKSRACVVADKNGSLTCVELTWGYEVPWQEGVVYNTRIESALAGSELWRDSFEHRRCVVPANAFFEGKPAVRFCAPDARMLLLAGVYENGRFSVVTRTPNNAVARVHDRMPLMLAPDEALTWLDPRTPLEALAQLANVSRETFATDSQLSLF